ncbi:MAG: hypothetical protein J0I43_08590 [Microbacterium sp.]|uniref:hypothetical protein n=1 Tax=Microbacterium sp. TaxID=51671 RepID=UPI001AC6F0D5|nr:hypothetical protein [Microbacterium sp.]MBN9177405.1 hypothetical protein [Microbacterium sp.]
MDDTPEDIANRGRSAEITAAELLAAARERWGGAAQHAATSEGQTTIALFDLFRLHVDGGGGPGRLSGWDRDLTGMLRSPASDDLARLFADVDRVIHDVATPEALDPTLERAHALGLLETRPELTWSEKRDAAVRARELRANRDPAFKTVDHDDLRRRIAQKWPGVPITQAAEIDWISLFRLRPYGTFRVGIGHFFREGIRADILAATPLREAVGTLGSLGSDSTAASVDDLLARMDAWLRLTLPPAEILALPLTDAE